MTCYRRSLKNTRDEAFVQWEARVLMTSEKQKETASDWPEGSRARIPHIAVCRRRVSDVGGLVVPAAGQEKRKSAFRSSPHSRLASSRVLLRFYINHLRRVLRVLLMRKSGPRRWRLHFIGYLVAL